MAKFVDQISRRKPNFYSPLWASTWPAKVVGAVQRVPGEIKAAVSCKMTIDMMELSEGELVEGSVGCTAEEFIKFDRDCKICLFI
jgi:DsrE/DsrF/DrsH-like family